MKLLKSILLLLCVFLFSQYVFADRSNPYRIIVKLKNMPKIASLAAIKPHLNDLEETLDLKINKVVPMAGGAYILIFEPDQIQQLAEKTRTTTDVAFNNLIQSLANKDDMIFVVQDRIVQLDHVKRHFFTQPPANISHDDQWDQRNIPESPSAIDPWGVNLAKAWDITKGENVVVAVIDTGIAHNNDLNGNILPGYNFYDYNNDNTDYGDQTYYNGTHVAGIIAANGVIFGMAPKTKIVPILVLKPDAYDSDIVNSMYWAVNEIIPDIPENPHPAKVLNLNVWARGQCSQLYQDAIDMVKSKGATVVFSATSGNENAQNVYPANCKNAITVAATNYGGIRALYSNYGSSITIAAPGGMTRVPNDENGILSTIKDGYIYYEGTSMAAPHVAGIAALIYSIKPNATPSQVQSLLTSTVHKFFVPPSHIEFDCTGTKTCGAGIVDAYAAVKAAQDAP